jgi:hypothetical protein
LRENGFITAKAHWAEIFQRLNITATKIKSQNISVLAKAKLINSIILGKVRYYMQLLPLRSKEQKKLELIITSS